MAFAPPLPDEIEESGFVPPAPDEIEKLNLSDAEKEERRKRITQEVELKSGIGMPSILPSGNATALERLEASANRIPLLNKLPSAIEWVGRALAETPRSLVNAPAAIVNTAGEAAGLNPNIRYFEHGEPLFPELLPEQNTAAQLLSFGLPGGEKRLVEAIAKNKAAAVPPLAGYAAGLAKAVEDLARGLTTPEVLMTLPAGGGSGLASRAVPTVFGLQMIKDTPEAYGEFGRTTAEGSPADVARAGLGALGSSAMILHMSEPGITSGRKPPGGDNASEIPGATRLPKPEVRPPVGEATSLRQPGEAAPARGIETPQPKFEPPKPEEVEASNLKFAEAIDAKDEDALHFLEQFNDWSRRRVAAKGDGTGIRTPEERALDDEAIDRFGTDTNFPELGWNSKTERGYKWNRETKRFEKPPKSEPAKAFGPDMDTMRRVGAMTPEEFNANATNFNKWNIEFGLNATPDEVAELFRLRDEASALTEAAKKKAEADPTEENIIRMQELSARPQFFNEAAQLGKMMHDTGLKYDGTIRGYHQFTDPVTKSSFAVKEGTQAPDIIKKMNEVRAKFEEANKPATAPSMKSGDKVIVKISSRGDRWHDAQISQVFDDGTFKVRLDKDGKFIEVKAKDIQERPQAAGRRRFEDEFAGLSEDERKQAKNDHAEFMRVIKESGPEHGWLPAEATLPTDLKAQGNQVSEMLKSAIRRAWHEANLPGNPESAIDRAKNLPALKDYLAKNPGRKLQEAEFQRATQKAGDKIPQDVGELIVGDKLIVEDVELKVTAKNDETGEITLEDGRKFGTQVVDGDTTLYVDRTELKEGAESVEFAPEEKQFEEMKAAESGKDRATIERQIANLEYRMKQDKARGMTRPENVQMLKELKDELAALNSIPEAVKISKTKPTLLEYAKSKLPPATAAKITDESQVESFRKQWERDYPDTKDIAAGQREDLNLVPDKAVDHERIAKEKADAERIAAEAKALQDKQQMDLLAEKPKATIKEVDELTNEPSGYSIGVGEEGKRFTLWHRSISKQTGRIKWEYLQNLGNSKESALANVNAAVSKHAGNSDVVLARKIVDTRTLGEDAVNPEGIIRFGKFTGTAIKDLPNKDMNYALWLARTFENDRDPNKRLVAKTLLTDERVREALDAEKKGAQEVENTLGPINEKLSPLGVKASMKGNEVLITGETFNMKDIIKEHHGRWNNDEKGWTFRNAADFEGFVRAIGERDAGTTGRLAGGAKFSAEGARLAELRDAASKRPDQGAIGAEEVNRLVGDDTKSLLMSGEKAGIPKSIIGEQIEDTARIIRAHESGKPMIILGSDPGSGKTFVLGAAIRELKKRGVEKITYVTMNQGLINQIKADLRAYGIDDVNFITYAGLRELEKIPENDALIFDEAHNIKNIVDSQQGKVAQSLLRKSKFNIFSTATPFENPSEVSYLDATGVFGEFGGWKNFAKAYGAQSRKLKDGSEIIFWKRDNNSNANQVAAREFFSRQGMFAQRDMKIDPKMFDIRLVKVQAPEKWAGLYRDLEGAIEEAAPDTNKDGNPMFRGYDAAWIVNFQKRILEASKVQDGIARAREALARGRQVVIFVETKAERELDIPDLIRRNEEWNAAKNAALMQKEKPPTAKEFGALSNPLTDLLRAMQRRGHEKIVIESAEDLIKKGLGEDNVAIYTGSVTDAVAQKNLQAWRDKQKKVLVATMAKGGTGLSLHDKIGDRPTTQININLPWKATGFKQVGGRSIRYGLKSLAESHWLFSDNIPFDKMLAGRVGGRLQDMGAMVNGAEHVPIAKNITDFEWDTEGEEIQGGFKKSDINTGNLGPEGMGGAKPAEFDRPGTFVSNMFAEIDRDRASLGKPPMEAGEPRTWDQDNQRALAEMNRNPNWIPELLDEVIRHPRPLMSWEQAGTVWQRAKWRAELNNAYRRINTAFEDKRSADVVAGKIDAAHFEALLEKMDKAVGRGGTGSEAGRSLRAQRMAAGDDFNLVEATLRLQASKGGVPLTDAERAELTKRIDELQAANKELQDHVKARDEKVARAEMEAAAERLRREAAEKKPSIPEVIIKKAEQLVQKLDTEADAARKRLREKSIRFNTGLDPTTLTDLAIIGASHVGHVGLDFAKWSAKMVSEFGDGIKPHLNDVFEKSKSLIDEIGKDKEVVEEVKKAKENPIDAAKTAIEDKVADDAMDEIGPYVQRIAKEYVRMGVRETEALIDAVHGELLDIIPDIERRQTMDLISGYGDFKSLSREEVAVALRGMKGEMQQLAKLEDMANGVPPLKSGLERRIPTDKERELIKAVNEAKLKFQVPMTDPIRQLKSALDTRKTALENRIKDLESRLARKDFTKKPRRELVVDRRAMELQAKVERLKKTVRAKEIEAERAARSKPEKAFDLVSNARRFAVLSGVKVLAKLAAYSATKLPTIATTEAVGALYSRLPFLNKIADKAPSEGGFNLTALAESTARAFTKGMEDAWKTMTTGSSDLKSAFSKYPEMERHWYDIPQSIHEVIKSPLRRAAFELSLSKRMAHAAKHGVDITDPLVQLALAKDAYLDSDRALLLEQNRLASGIRGLFRTAEQKSKATGKPTLHGKAAATLGRVEFPILTVPLNYAKQTLVSAFGLISGGSKALRAYSRGIENLKPEEADAILRHLKYGTVGGAMLLWGFFDGYNNGSGGTFGGYYQPGQKRKEDEAQPGGVRIGEKNVSSVLLHNPIIAAAQFGHTIGAIAQSKLKKSDPEKRGITSGTVAATMGLINESPLGRQVELLNQLSDPRSSDYAFGEHIKGLTVPQISNEAAQVLDRDAYGNVVKRNPRTVLEHIKTGIPLLRQQVPEKPRKR